MKVREWTGRARIRLTCGDCMDGLKAAPDNNWQLAICDPPYGETCRLQGGRAAKDGYAKYWDKIDSADGWNTAPKKEYFSELQRASQDQIIWGANHYPQHLPPSSGWVFWDKGQRDFSFSDGELAFTSFGKKLKAVTIHRAELHKEERNHPTQKPTKLYRWLLSNYAKKGDRILDTHGGSMSIALACWDAGHDLDAWEMDEDYFEAACDRIDRHVAQGQFDL